jgi:hypothetical protein
MDSTRQEVPIYMSRILDKKKVYEKIMFNPILPCSGDSDTGCSAADSALPNSDDSELCKGIVTKLRKKLIASYNIKY